MAIPPPTPPVRQPVEDPNAASKTVPKVYTVLTHVGGEPGQVHVAMDVIRVAGTVYAPTLVPAVIVPPPVPLTGWVA